MASMAGEIIGRDAELTDIESFLDHPPDGTGALVLEGEAGIGKSTLWLAGVAAARDRHLAVLTSRPAEAERALAYVVLGDLFADAEPDLLAALPGPRRRAFEAALLREEPDLPIDPHALGVAILTLLPVVARGRPLVLAIDDDQWLDRSSAATLGFALRRVQRLPILLLISRRLDGLPAMSEELIDQADVRALRVGPLSIGAIQLLLHRELGAAFPRPTLLRIHEVSGGNPFFALELARAISIDPARDPTAPMAVPASLERLVTARLGGLSALTRRALLLVAANGRLPHALLRVLEVVPEALDQARAANVVETVDGVVRFTHPLLASTLYQGAPSGERREAHRRLAAAIDDPVDRGRHLALSTEVPDEDLAAALESAMIAASNRGMPLAAAELAEHAHRLTPTDEVDARHRRAIATGRLHLAAGEGRRARAIAADVLASAPAGPRRAEALVLLSDLEQPGIALPLLLQALTEAAGAPALEAAIHLDLTNAGRFVKGRRWAERQAQSALRTAAGLNDDTLRANALSILALLRFDRGDAHGLDLAERAYRLAMSLPDPRQVKGVGSIVGHVLTWSARPEQARKWLERQLEDWGDRDEQVRSELLWYLALVELWSGRWSNASGYADEALEIGMQYGNELPQDHLGPAFIALHRGQFSVARDHSQRALSLARGEMLPAHVAILAACDLWSGHPAAALAGFVRAEQAADVRGFDEPSMREWRAEYAEALLQVGHIDQAARLVAEWETAATRLGRERVLALAVRCRGMIAAARGDLVVATGLLEEAVDRHEAVGDPYGRGRALLALGVVRRRMRQKRAARAALEAALAAFEALGAASWAATARSELGRIGGRQRLEGLSPSELRVAELVAEGRTNREIASALFLGERTVASHLTHIYSKLGIRSRTELARHLHSGGAPAARTASKVPTS
ncbi:MAG TPA: AAA family ATPase [Candidatus Limnocylindrales bacterium]|nr:AAA family ATPase [Candidatus Limnocylindrales bacterium]